MSASSNQPLVRARANNPNPNPNPNPNSNLLECVVEPALVLVVDEAVGEDALALMLPPGARDVAELLFVGMSRARVLVH